MFPGARMDDGTEEELEIDVELLNWEDCCQHMVARVDKMWKQHSGQKSALHVSLAERSSDSIENTRLSIEKGAIPVKKGTSRCSTC